MKKYKKRILIAAPGIILLVLFLLYYIFPGIVYKTLIAGERNAAGLIHKSVDIEERHVECEKCCHERCGPYSHAGETKRCG